MSSSLSAGSNPWPRSGHRCDPTCPTNHTRMCGSSSRRACVAVRDGICLSSPPKTRAASEGRVVRHHSQYSLSVAKITASITVTLDNSKMLRARSATVNREARLPRPPSQAVLFNILRTTCPPPAPIPHRIHRHRSLRPLPTISHQRSTWDRSGPHRTQSDPTGPEKDPTGHLWDTERETVAQPQNPGWNVR